MKNFFFFSVFFCGLLCAAVPDVRDFGAKGDGKTDDTQAIRKAVRAVAEKVTTYGTGTLYFSPGRYVISDSIDVEKIHLKGTSAVIFQKNPRKDIFNYNYAWNVKVSGIEFHGGRNQLSFANKNIDKGMILIRDCRFFDASGIAVGTRIGSNSTFFIVEGCLFIKCIQAMESNCDWAVLRDSWITSSVNMRNMATVVNRHGVMTVDNMLGVPLCNGDRQRWIDNYGSLFVSNSRFGGEGGGFTPVYNFAKYKIHGSMAEIVISRSWVCANTNREAVCAVYCKEIPNLIRVDDCYVSGLPPVKVAKQIDLKNYFYTVPGTLRFECSNLGGQLLPMPELLKKPVIHPPLLSGQLTPEKCSEILKGIKVPPAAQAPARDLLADKTLVWSADGYMDDTVMKNSDYLLPVRRGKVAGIQRRVPGKKTDWPHLTVHNIPLDLKRYPVFVMECSSATPAEYAIKFYDPDRDKLFAPMSRQRKPGKFEFDLAAKFPDMQNCKNLQLRIYYMGKAYQEQKLDSKIVYLDSPAGSVLWISKLGFAKKSK